MSINKGSDGDVKGGGLDLRKMGNAISVGTGSPTDGATGTRATGRAQAGPGAWYYDYTNGLSWQNIGTKGSPKWVMPQFIARVAITSANILGMFTTPVAILAAPGANRIIIVDSITFTMTTTATAYAAGGAVSFVYHGTSTAAHTGTLLATVVTAAAGTSITVLGQLAGANGTTLTGDTNLGIDITNATAAFTTGTGTAVVAVAYSIVPTT